MKRKSAIIFVFILLIGGLVACGDSDEGKAKGAAKEYCKMLESNNDSIESISFTGVKTNVNDTYYFEVEVVYSDFTREGDVECIKDSDGTYSVNGLMFDD